MKNVSSSPRPPRHSSVTNITRTFTAFLHANSIIVESSQRPESPASYDARDSKKLFVLKLTEESPALQQEIGDALIDRFLAADEENKAQNK